MKHTRVTPMVLVNGARQKRRLRARPPIRPPEPLSTLGFIRRAFVMFTISRSEVVREPRVVVSIPLSRPK